nr:uncharacterized protein LOC106624666 isoform X1 [Bactrocera oleae]
MVDIIVFLCSLNTFSCMRLYICMWSIMQVKSKIACRFFKVKKECALISEVINYITNATERSSNTYPDTGALWLPFQTAAGTVTTLYKEACDGVKRTSDSAVQCGYQRRTRELADWARSKKRRMIRREDLLAYLAGKPLTNTNRRSPKPEHSHNHSNTGAVFNTNASHHTSPHMYSSHHHHAQHQHQNHHHQATGGGATNEPTTDLHTFKEALVLRPRGPELFAFVANEIARHCKRPASPIDDKMDICHYSSKRQRFM